MNAVETSSNIFWTHSYILTGAPGAGKTSIIEELEKREYLVVHEAATKVIKKRNAKGKETDRGSPTFSAKILTTQKRSQRELLQIAQKTGEACAVFLDRSVVDILGYHRYFGTEPSESLQREIKKLVVSEHKPMVFYIEQWGETIQTPERNEDSKQAADIAKTLKETYEQHGFRVTVIPRMEGDTAKESILHRTNELLKHIPPGCGVRPAHKTTQA